MSIPLIGIGSGLALGSLLPFVVEPAVPEGVQAAQRDYGLDLSVYEQNSFCILQWAVIDGEEDMRAIFAQMGLDTFLRQAVTAYLPDWQSVWGLYNAYAIRPARTTYALWPQNVRVLLNQVEQIG